MKNTRNHSKLYLVFLIFLAFNINVSAQNEGQNSLTAEQFLSELFASDKTFDQITTAADLFFKQRYPNLTKAELCQGENRDGDFVKYERWKSFWKHHLNEDGTLGDFTKSRQDALKSGSNNPACTEEDFLVNWTNSNYTSNMGWQIDQGRTNCMAFHPTNEDIFYVGASFGGLWKTTDGGSSYTLLNDDLPHAAVSGIAIDPNDPDHIAISLSDILWYGPPGIGVYISTDGGATFQASTQTWSLPDNVRIYYMDQDPFNGNNIIIATNDGLFKTDDFFATSTQVENDNMRHVTYSQTTQGLVYAGGGSGRFYRSTDGGNTFNSVTDFGNDQVRIAVPLGSANSSHVVATHGSTLYRSTDEGQTFTSKPLPESNMVIEFEPGSETVLNAGNFEAYRSDNFGDSFTTLTHWFGDGGLPWIHVDQRNIFVNPLQDDYVYFCNDGGIFRYDNSVSQFANLCSDLIITQYYDIAVSQTDALVLGAGSQDNGNVFRESNGSWDQYAPTGDGMGQEIHPLDAGIRYWSYQFGAIRRWENGTNNGIAPPGLDGSGAWETPFKIDPNNPDGLFIGYQDVYYSPNQGNTWTNLGSTSSNNNLEQIAIAPSNSDRVYATRNNQFYMKASASANWVNSFTPVGQYISDLEVDFQDEDVVYISYSGYSDGKKVYKSIDGGQNWTNITDNLPNLPVMSLELYENQSGGIFIGTYGAVYYRDDSMSQWRKMGCLPNTAVNDIEIQYFTDRIFVGTHGRGVFEADISFDVASTIESTTNTASQLILYPNPALNQVSIKAKKGSLDHASLRLTDMLGREYNANYQFVNGEIKINCASLSSGNYLIHVNDSNGRISKLRFTVQ
jgi:photosystem II stability/assembly factor-like uncharacterized protein